MSVGAGEQAGGFIINIVEDEGAERMSFKMP
jgi:hypothetical protein